MLADAAAVMAYLEPRCVEDGDCLLWQLACNGAGNPVASLEGRRSVPVRRWVWQGLNPGRILTGELRVVPSCGNALCMAHLQALTPSAVNRAIAARGGFSTPAFRKARRDAGRAQGKLTLADARMIRHRRWVLGETLTAIKPDYPVSLSVLSHICRGEAWPDPAGNPFAGLTP